MKNKFVQSKQQTYWKWSLILLILLILLVMYDLTLGSFSISFADIWKALFAHDTNSQSEIMVRIFRFPRVITGVMVGIALSVSGLLLQTLFQNPLAGPYVLGINSGASLFVAISTMFSFHVISTSFSLVTAAMVGAFLVGLLVLASSLYLKNKISLLLVGIMLGSFIGAIVSVIQSYADPNDLKTFMLWSFGSLQSISYSQLPGLFVVVLMGFLLSLLIAKPLNLLVLGDKNASILGVNTKQIRFVVVLITSILSGVITAYCGPIAFVGLIIPNMVKFVYKTTNHFQLILGSALMGAVLIVFCDILMQLLMDTIKIPLNALTALIGAPVVVWIILKKF
ncbi:MAG: iron ABC transporter permease [Brumimicrobium sp.]|nr:iron ABC transporter permease [Brumimicrobium sp.]MCO5269125.1 iron ABC transporter permease [Brumimicrobium sp.]